MVGSGVVVLVVLFSMHILRVCKCSGGAHVLICKIHSIEKPHSHIHTLVCPRPSFPLAETLRALHSACNCREQSIATMAKNNSRIPRALVFALPVQQQRDFRSAFQQSSLTPDRCKRAPMPGSALRSGQMFSTPMTSFDQLADHHAGVRQLGVRRAVQTMLNHFQDEVVSEWTVCEAISMSAVGTGAFAERVKQANKQVFAVMLDVHGAKHRPSAEQEPVLFAATNTQPKPSRTIAALLMRLQWAHGTRDALQKVMRDSMARVLVADQTTHAHYVLQQSTGVVLVEAAEALQTQMQVNTGSMEKIIEAFATVTSERTYQKNLDLLFMHLEVVRAQYSTLNLLVQCLVQWNRDAPVMALEQDSLQPVTDVPLYNAEVFWQLLRWVRDGEAFDSTVLPEAIVVMDQTTNTQQFADVYNQALPLLESSLATLRRTQEHCQTLLIPQAMEQVNRWGVADAAPVLCKRVRSSEQAAQTERVLQLPVHAEHGLLQHLAHVLRVPRFTHEFHRAQRSPWTSDYRSTSDQVSLVGGPELWEVQWHVLVQVYERTLRKWVQWLVQKYASTTTVPTTASTSANPLVGDPSSELLQTLEVLMCATLAQSGMFDPRTLRDTACGKFAELSGEFGGPISSWPADAYADMTVGRWGPLPMPTEIQWEQVLGVLIASPHPLAQQRVRGELQQSLTDANKRLRTYAEALGARPSMQWSVSWDATKHAVKCETLLRQTEPYFSKHSKEKVYASTQPVADPQAYLSDGRLCSWPHVTNTTPERTLVPVFLSYFCALRAVVESTVRATMSVEVTMISPATLAEQPNWWAQLGRTRAASIGGHTLRLDDSAVDTTSLALLLATHSGLFDRDSALTTEVAACRKELLLCQHKLTALMDQATVLRDMRL